MAKWHRLPAAAAGEKSNPENANWRRDQERGLLRRATARSVALPHIQPSRFRSEFVAASWVVMPIATNLIHDAGKSDSNLHDFAKRGKYQPRRYLFFRQLGHARNHAAVGFQLRTIVIDAVPKCRIAPLL
jgi:hypothetical protein